MTTINDLRSILTAYPSIAEAAKSTSFRTVTFKVNGKGIIGVEKDMIHVTFALNEENAQAALANPDLAAEAINKNGTLIGVRIDMSRLTLAQLNSFVAQSVAR